MKAQTPRRQAVLPRRPASWIAGGRWEWEEVMSLRTYSDNTRRWRFEEFVALHRVLRHLPMGVLFPAVAVLEQLPDGHEEFLLPTPDAERLTHAERPKQAQEE